MMKTVYYSERQRFNQWWVWGSAFLGPVLLFLPLLGLILSGSSYIVLLLIFILTFWLPIFLYCIHLDTEVNEYAISVKFRFSKCGISSKSEMRIKSFAFACFNPLRI